MAGIHNGDQEAVACPLLIGEVRETLAKPYFRALLSELEAQEAVEAYRDLAVMFADPIDVEPVLRDPEDDYLVALARASDAEAIITGDKDLLDHVGLRPLAVEARAACELMGLIERS
ncbi:MAG TPA: putative toxin-antitoxin system toxin component, PIN family [Solirubrobacteraceae bacterium]